MPNSDGNIIVTGGSGLLGTELRKYLPNALYPTHLECNVDDYQSVFEYVAKHAPVSIILHAAAFTSPPRCESEPMRALQTNIVGTCNVVQMASEFKARLVYISTDYVFDGNGSEDLGYTELDPVFPVNRYAWSKLGGECAVKMYRKALIIRCSFGPDVFPYQNAFIDQYTTREPVSVTAQKVASLTVSDVVGVMHIGGKRQSVWEYAESLDPDRQIGRISREDVGFEVPPDTSLDDSAYRAWLYDQYRNES